MGPLTALASNVPAARFIADHLREPKSVFALLAVGCLVLYGLSVGRTRALVSLLSIYVAYVLTLLFPFDAWIAGRVSEQYRAFTTAALFLVFYLLAFGLIGRSMRKTRLTLGEISFLQVSLISIVQIGLLASIALSLLPAELTERMWAPFRQAVAGNRMLWVWAVASLAILPLMRARRKV